MVEIKRDERANSPRQRERERERKNQKVSSRSVPFFFFFHKENNFNDRILFLLLLFLFFILWNPRISSEIFSPFYLGGSRVSPTNLFGLDSADRWNQFSKE